MVEGKDVKGRSRKEQTIGKIRRKIEVVREKKRFMKKGCRGNGGEEQDEREAGENEKRLGEGGKKWIEEKRKEEKDP